MKYGGYTYIMTNAHHTVLYVGVTSTLSKRVAQHKDHTFKDSFTAKYNLNKLVYYELHPTIEEAVSREKQLKAGPRSKKEELIRSVNPDWKDLSDEIWNY